MKNTATIIFLFIHVLAQGQSFNYPIAPMDSTRDVYFGQTVYDPYRWLETDSSSATRQWVDDEMGYTEKYLRKLKNKYSLDDQLRANSVFTHASVHKSGIYYFDMMRENGSENASLFIKKELDDVVGTKIVDPDNYKEDKWDKVAIKNFKVSDDNKYLAFGLAYNGSDWHTIRVKSIHPNRDEDDEIRGVKFSEIAWYKDGFFYMQYPPTENMLTDITLNATLKYHRMSTQQSEDAVIYQDNKYPDAQISFTKVACGTDQYLVIYHANRDIHKVLAINLAPGMSQWKFDTLVISRQKASFDVIGLYNDQFLVATDLNAPNGKVVLFKKGYINMASEFIPEYKQVLHRVSIIGDKVICIYLDDIDYEAITFDRGGNATHKIAFPVGSSVDGFEGNCDAGSTIFYQYSFLFPAVVYEYWANEETSTLVTKTGVTYDINDFEMEKVYYYSKDSTMIPMILAHKKGLKKNGKNPTLLYGYGGYGQVTTPFYSRGFISFIQNGGIVAIPAIRGGGEYGRKWHEEGQLQNKENVFDDFIGAAEFLTAEHYTSSEKLAIMGGSNGGLLVAAVLNRRPDICKAAIAINGVYDMLRYQLYTIGHAWVAEFGSSSNPQQFPSLYHYSPQHNIRDTSYPAVLVVTGDHDDRAVPMHSYKYVAAMQYKNTGDNPILLLVQENAGHQDNYLELDVDIYSFIYDELGMRASRIQRLH